MAEILYIMHSMQDSTNPFDYMISVNQEDTNDDWWEEVINYLKRFHAVEFEILLKTGVYKEMWHEGMG